MRRRFQLLVVLAAFVTSMLGATGASAALTDIRSAHKNLFFVAVASDNTLYREQDILTYYLAFDHPASSLINVGLTVSTVGAATFSAVSTGSTIELTLVSAPASVYTSAVSGTLEVHWEHDGDPGSATLSVEFRAIDVGKVVLFEGYTTTSIANSDVTPITINGQPPFVGATQYGWEVLCCDVNLGLVAASLVPHDGLFGAQTRRWLSVTGGANWAVGDGTLRIVFSNNISGSIAWQPSITIDVSLRKFSDLTIYQGQVLYEYEGAISAPAAPSESYSLFAVLADGSSISLDSTRAGVSAAGPSGGWDTDTTMDVEVSYGIFSMTSSVRDVDVRFRALLGDGYTLVEGHQRGEEVINIALPNDTYSFDIEPGSSAFPTISQSGITPELDFAEGGDVTDILMPPPDVYWGSEDTFNLLIRDGARPLSRVPRNVSFRKFPSELTYFEQQVSAEPAIQPSVVGDYAINAVDCAGLTSPLGTLPSLLADPSPRPVFATTGALDGYLFGGATPTAHVNCLLIGDATRPWSAGALVRFELRYFADFAANKFNAGNPLLVPENGSFDVQIIDALDDWAWSIPSLTGFDAGIVTVGAAESATGSFSASGVMGVGRLLFAVGASQTNPDHPLVYVELGPGPPGVPLMDGPGRGLVALLLLLSAGLVMRFRSFATAW